MINFDKLDKSQIQNRLHDQGFPTYDVPPEMLKADCREAAVLVPFVRIDDAWHLLFIRRTTFEGDRHSGQVAFAGGKREIEDIDLEATALREAEEEIGLQLKDVEVLGRINHHHTISQFQVTPYVATFSWPYPLKLDQTEVARAFTIPLNWLADDRNYKIDERFHPESNKRWPIIYYDYFDGELLWGATARMTLSLLDVLT
ncbi:MAG: 8-oxo-dGTP pyrophosphatase MutT (NUDIX family) [Gammaproteobacteria bacterium]|jgi:8-oxo-dGTP pyrophosphatase MutT (NUDIX family)